MLGPSPGLFNIQLRECLFEALQQDQEEEEVAGSRLQSATSRTQSRLSSRSSRSRLSSAEVARASRPASTASTASTRSKQRSRPASGKSLAWQENEEKKTEVEEEGEEEDEEEGGHHVEEDLGPLVIKGEDDIPKGCWFAFLQSFNGLWSTKDMNDELDREQSVRTTVRELVVYMLFLMILVICE